MYLDITTIAFITIGPATLGMVVGYLVGISHIQDIK